MQILNLHNNWMVEGSQILMFLFINVTGLLSLPKILFVHGKSPLK